MRGKTNGLQIAGFVVSLVSFFILGLWGLSGITGLVLSAVGRSRAKKVDGKTGLGMAGIVLGSISAVFGLINFGLAFFGLVDGSFLLGFVSNILLNILQYAANGFIGYGYYY